MSKYVQNWNVSINEETNIYKLIINCSQKEIYYCEFFTNNEAVMMEFMIQGSEDENQYDDDIILSIPNFLPKTEFYIPYSLKEKDQIIFIFLPSGNRMKFKTIKNGIYKQKNSNEVS